MSVLLSFAIFPLDSGKKGVSESVSKVIEMLKSREVSYKLNAMGTVIETDTMREALDIVNDAYEVLLPYSDRIYITINIDARKGRSNGMSEKINAVKKRVGEVSI